MFLNFSFCGFMGDIIFTICPGGIKSKVNGSPTLLQMEGEHPASTEPGTLHAGAETFPPRVEEPQPQGQRIWREGHPVRHWRELHWSVASDEACLGLGLCLPWWAKSSLQGLRWDGTDSGVIAVAVLQASSWPPALMQSAWGNCEVSFGAMSSGIGHLVPEALSQSLQ